MEEKDPVTEAEKEGAPAEEAPAEEKEKKARPKGTADVKKLRSSLDAAEKKLAVAEAKIEETNDRYLRVLAEYDNFRKRSQKDRELARGDAVTDTLTGLLPIIDNLMYAQKYGGADPDKFAEGVKLILDSLPATLGKMNVSVFGEAGETFDPEIHNAVMHVDDDSYGEGEIVEVLQVGYKYKDKVIRHAMVKVAN
ncbi:MAG: nucleotide exchange factor GrpE [Clostridia bacterium]|nr:nucleotide exchange factor GrpE [Clostridia bacterium]